MTEPADAAMPRMVLLVDDGAEGRRCGASLTIVGANPLTVNEVRSLFTSDDHDRRGAIRLRLWEEKI